VRQEVSPKTFHNKLCSQIFGHDSLIALERLVIASAMLVKSESKDFISWFTPPILGFLPILSHLNSMV